MKSETKIERPDPPKTAIDAFYHLFTLEKFLWETEIEYKERVATREIFTEQLAREGLSPSQYYSLISKPINLAEPEVKIETKPD